MQALVLAGGRGTRLHERGAPPKVLTPLAGLPMLTHVIGRLAAEGVDDIVALIGHRGDEVAAALADARLGVRVRWRVEANELGTAGALEAARELCAERFFVVMADVLADVDLRALMAAHRRTEAWATLVAHPNDHPFDSDRLVTDASGRVIRIVRPSQTAGIDAGALCNAGLHVVERAALDFIGATPCDLTAALWPALIAAGKRVVAYRTAEYLKDMGTPERRARVDADLRAGVPARMRRGAFRPAVLFDRDGTLVEDRPHIARAEDLVPIGGAGAALRRLNEARIATALVTNQPAIARGELDEDGLHRLHTLLEGQLARDGGGWLDALFVCPHHTDAGFAGERPELKIECDCRKPRPGLLHQACVALSADRRATVMVGDRTADLEAARAAGVLAIGVSTGAACRDGRHPVAAETPLVPSVAEAVALVLDTAPSWRPWLERARRAGAVALAGPPGSGTTVVAAGLRLALGAEGVGSLHVSLERFVARGLGIDVARQAMVALADGESVLLPGYDPIARAPAPSTIARWDRRDVLIVEGVHAHEAAPSGALAVALVTGGGDWRLVEDAIR
ncbi:MAG TPA: HAD-IIIA family hydrolase [Polyangia bacterium]|nr:HAD-IIIA family hydrolase [Polyangia bacterium]